MSVLVTVMMATILAQPSSASRMNVLFVVSDDLRPELGVYGGSAITPNLDKFASSNGTTVFTRAYVQQAICCPTRSSFLTGRRPDTTKVWDLHTQFRISGGNFTTLPQFFREHGYWSQGMGKVFHPVPYMGKTDDVAGGSWSAPYFHARGLGGNMTMCWNENNNSESMFVDNKLAANAVEVLRNVSKLNQPFFVAVGLHRPHLPWDVPEKYYALYEAAEIIPLANFSKPPKNYNITGAQPWSWDPQSGPRHCGPLRNETHPVATLPEYGLVPDPIARQFRRAYYAAVSQTDANFGTVMDELTLLGLESSTIVTFIGDHGWQLGDLGEFGKKTNFERATRTPFILRDPSAVSRPPALSSQLVEFVDIMPTIIDIAGFDVPPTCPPDSSKIANCVEGSSLKAVLERPFEDWGKDAAYMQYAHCMHDEGVWHDGCDDPSEPKVMGYAIRTRQWRYIEWVAFNKTTTPPTIHWDQLLGSELYDHTENDTVENVAESVNVVANPSNAATVKFLSEKLHAGWRTTKAAMTVAA